MSSPISGFTAIPNPQMLAFMPIQSYLMMYFAGAGWQIGKRKISAIPNDKFNKMSAKELLEGFTADLRSTIPTLERSLKDITPLITTLIEQYGDFVTIALKEIPQAAQGIIESQLTKEGTLSKLIIEVVGGGTTVGGGGSQSQGLAFAKFQLQAEVDRLKIEADELKKSKKFVPSSALFHGPGIVSRTGEESDLSKKAREDRLRLEKAKPQAHIKSRPRSNVSLQSLTIEKSRLTQEYSRQKLIYDEIPSFQRGTRNTQWQRVLKAEQDYANFWKMHGSRFR